MDIPKSEQHETLEPHVDSVRTVVVNKENPEEFLLVFEDGEWKHPGGKFELDANGEVETPEAATARELLQEVGIAIDPADVVIVSVLPNGDKKRYVSTISVADDEIHMNPQEIEATRWFTQATVPGGKYKDHILHAVQAVFDVRDQQS